MDAGTADPPYVSLTSVSDGPGGTGSSRQVQRLNSGWPPSFSSAVRRPMARGGSST